MPAEPSPSPRDGAYPASVAEPSDAQVKAVLAYLNEEDGPPFGSANVRDFFPDDEPAPAGPEREAALAALRAADEAAYADLREWARRLAAAVLDAK